jgi:DNA-binding transcriptional ArsR family regulator
MEITLSSVVFRNMSSEPTPQPAPQPAPRSAAAGEARREREGDPPITDPIAMRALAHPVRVALVEMLSAAGTLTATQASELLGESPANCAFHLRTLAKYGFVEEAGGGRGRERPWKAADRPITISKRQDDPRAATAAGALARTWLELWIERARRVFGSDLSLPGWENASGWSRMAVFLTPEETLDLRAQMRRLLEPYEARTSNPALRPPGALPVEWTVFNAPVPELAGFAEAQAREAAQPKDDPAPDSEA